jgi:hypothetical protein
VGRLMRFDWETVVEWLKGLAAADASNLQQRRRVSRRTPGRKKSAVA